MKKNRKSNISIILIVLIIVGVLGAVFYFNSYKQKNETTTQNKKTFPISASQNNEYIDQDSGLIIKIPKVWLGHYKILTSKKENKKLVSFYYIDLKGNKDFITSLIAYKAPYSVEKINNTPNQVIVIQNDEYAIAYTSNLEIPFEDGTKDFMNYTKMINSINSLLNNLSFKKGIYSKRKKIYEAKNFEGKKYSLIISYPEFFDLSTTTNKTALQKINKNIKNTIDLFVNNFKNNLKNSPKIKKLADITNKLNISYEEISFSEICTSLNYQIDKYLAGIAHPKNLIISRNYLFKNGQLVSLNDLFEKNKNYLPLLSKLVEKNLKIEFSKKKIDIDHNLISDGFSPKINNFSNFNLTPQGIIFNFQPGSVAPRYLGSFKVFISYNDLDKIGFKGI